MKKLFVILGVLLLAGTIFVPENFAAVTPTPTPSDTKSIENQIDNLKDRIASRVAQLNLVEKRGIIGTVTDISETQMTLNDLQGNTRFVDVDELTKFSSAAAKSSFGISDISKGTTLGVIGLYNKDSKRILARFVDVFTEPQVYSGAILSLDSDNFTFTIATPAVDEQEIDVENITKTVSYTANGGAVKSGFSKLAVGKRVMIVGFFDAKNPKLLVASRIIFFPDLAVNPKVPLVKPEDIAPVTPSTGSGKKLTPIVK